MDRVLAAGHGHPYPDEVLSLINANRRPIVTRPAAVTSGISSPSLFAVEDGRKSKFDISMGRRHEQSRWIFNAGSMIVGEYVPYCQ